ncbi:MAG: GNAT family N-acetyltransferase [Bacteroidales bacterium]|nr:GNAT family N-acetyltransferase [Bacteroidales bacterium]
MSRDLVCIILDKNDRIVAFAVTIPSLSKAFKKANGKLFPFGFVHILRALKKNDLLEALMIGVDPEHQGKGLNAIIFNHIRRGAQKFGLKKMVMNPRLETNKKVRAIFDEFNPQLYMRRRCYKANLSTVEQTISTSSSQM